MSAIMAHAMLLGGGGAGGGGGISARYWRIRITANNGDTYFCIQEVEIRGSVGGADLTTDPGVGGTTTVTVTSQFAPQYAGGETIDNNFTDNQSVWLSDASPGTADLVYDMQSAVSVAEFAIWAQNFGTTGANRAPKDFTIASSPDNSTWTTRKTVTNETGWTAGGSKTFAL